MSNQNSNSGNYHGVTGKDTSCLLESMSWHPIKLQTTTPNGADGGKSDKTLVIFSDQKGPDSMRFLHQEA